MEKDLWVHISNHVLEATMLTLQHTKTVQSTMSIKEARELGRLMSALSDASEILQGVFDDNNFASK